MLRRARKLFSGTVSKRSSQRRNNSPLPCFPSHVPLRAFAKLPCRQSFVCSRIHPRLRSLSHEARSAILLALFALPVSAIAQSAPPSPRPITIDDYFQIQTVHDPQLSPDAHWVAYAVDKSTLKTDKNETRIWMVPSSGGDALP